MAKETLKGEVIDVNDQPVNEQDPRYVESEKTAMDFWTQIRIDGLTTELNNIQSCNGRTLIVGHDSVIIEHKADDTWAKYVVDAAPDLDINNICHNGTAYIIICGNGKAYTSKTLEKGWTELALPANAGPLYGSFVTDKKCTILVGANGAVIWSTDGGTEWKPNTIADVDLNDVIMVKDHFYAVGNKGVIAMSTTQDPADDWELILPAGFEPYAQGKDFEFVTYNEATDEIVCGGCMLNTCSFKPGDKETSPHGCAINNQIFDICSGAGRLLVCGASLIAASENAEVALSFCPYPCAEVLIGCAFIGDTFYCVGENGMIVINKPNAPVDQDAETWAVKTVTL